MLYRSETDIITQPKVLYHKNSAPVTGVFFIPILQERREIYGKKEKEKAPETAER